MKVGQQFYLAENTDLYDTPEDFIDFVCPDNGLKVYRIEIVEVLMVSVPDTPQAQLIPVTTKSRNTNKKVK